MEKKRKSRIGGFFIIVGIVLILGAIGLTVYNMWDTNRAGEAADAVMEQLQEEIEKRKEENGDTRDFSDLGDLMENQTMPTIEIDGYRYIGYLDVPAAGLYLPIMEEWDTERLKITPCRYSGSIYNDDMVLAGHNYRRHFSPLRWQDIGTEIDFIDVEGNVYRFQIAEIEILEPVQVEKMVQASENWDLTLFTCTLSGQTRYTIRCTKMMVDE